MATIVWRGDEPETTEVITLTVSSAGSSSATLTVAINGKTVGVAVVNLQTAAVTAALLYAALAATTIPEFLEYDWSYVAATAVVTGTNRVPGMSGTITGSTAGGQTVTSATATTGTGPNDVNNAANYVGGALPVNADGLVVNGGGSLLWNLDALVGVQLASLTIGASFTGTIGLPEYHANSGYREYRQRYFQCDGNPTVSIGNGQGAGSQRILLDLTGSTGTISVVTTSQRIDAAVPAVNVQNFSAAVNVIGGDVGIAAEQGQTATASTLRTPVGSGSPPKLVLGAGAAVTTGDIDGGTIDSYGAVTTLGQTGGRWTQWGAVPTTINNDGGTTALRGTGTVTTATFRGPDAVCDCAGDPQGKTFTDHTFIGGAKLDDPNKDVTFTNTGTWDMESVKASNFGNGQFSLKRS